MAKKKKKKHDFEHQTLSWLQCDLNVVIHMLSLYCAVCGKHKVQLYTIAEKLQIRLDHGFYESANKYIGGPKLVKQYLLQCLYIYQQAL